MAKTQTLYFMVDLHTRANVATTDNYKAEWEKRGFSCVGQKEQPADLDPWDDGWGFTPEEKDTLLAQYLNKVE